MMMMIPEPWSNHESMSQERKDFYEFHGCLMEPWDGPASVAFTDGIRIGATLDRNGLRPSRYYVTKDDLVVMASEVGVLDIPPERILKKGRLQPGRMFLVDTSQGRIIGDDEIKQEMAAAAPYGAWLKENMVAIGDLPKPATVIPPDHETVLRRQETFGYTTEDLKVLVAPMADRRRRGDRLDGDRHAAGGAVEPAAAALQLLQAAVRAGDQPAGRRHPRRDHHGGRHGDRPRGQPAGADARVGAPDRAADAGAAQRGAGEAAPPGRRQRLARLQEHHAADAVRRSRTAATGLAAGIETLRAAASKAIADGCNIIILSDRGHDARARADPGAAGDRGGAAPPAARGVAHARRPGGRERRAARGAPLRAAARLRRQRDQPLPGVREPGTTCASQGMLPTATPSKAEREVRQGGRQGDREGLLEDGDLDHPELSRRAGVRGDRPQPGVHRRVLHLDGVARGRHRHRRDRRATSRSARRARSRSARCRRTAWIRAASTSTAATASSTCSTRVTIHKLQHACRTGDYKRVQGVLAPDRRSVEDAVPRCAA